MANNLTTYEGVQEYFDLCRGYWLRQGDSGRVAFSKAFWWDCVEMFNLGKSWNDAKEQFAMDVRGYRVGRPVPDPGLVEKGEV